MGVLILPDSLMATTIEAKIEMTITTTLTTIPK